MIRLGTGCHGDSLYMWLLGVKNDLMVHINQSINQLVCSGILFLLEKFVLSKVDKLARNAALFSSSSKERLLDLSTFFSRNSLFGSNPIHTITQKFLPCSLSGKGSMQLIE